MIEEIDHAPPRTFFYGKHRPKGLEVPSCKRCNKVFSKFDDFFALLAFSQASFQDDRLDPRINNMISGSVRRFPDAILEIVQSGQRAYFGKGNTSLQPGVRIKFDHPDIHFAMNFSIARLVAANYYSFSKMSAPIGSTIATSWFSNAQPMPTKHLKAMLSKMPNYHTLRQGDGFNVSDQYEARLLFSEEMAVGGCAFHFHRAFVGVGFLLPSFADIDEKDEEHPLFSITDNGIEPVKGFFPLGVRLPKRRSR